MASLHRVADRSIRLVVEGGEVFDLCVDFGPERCHPLLLHPVIGLEVLEGFPSHHQLVDPGRTGGDDVSNHLPGHHCLFDVRGVHEADAGSDQSVHVGIDRMCLDVGLDPGQLRVAKGDLRLQAVEVGRNGGQLCGEIADPGDADRQLGLDLGPPGDRRVDQIRRRPLPAAPPPRPPAPTPRRSGRAPCGGRRPTTPRAKVEKRARRVKERSARMRTRGA